eukprot:286509-Prymnesium_polylepis.1
MIWKTRKSRVAFPRRRRCSFALTASTHGYGHIDDEGAGRPEPQHPHLASKRRGASGPNELTRHGSRACCTRREASSDENCAAKQGRLHGAP